ncbi:AB-hydrolase associated lipase region containing protein [Cavenderia fasciculata]|uniref:AB-hydrolase associated lipase region containing protein n=1 Tax=Cavenderia fasciculata TaxID=261658 RepID=F4QCP8_CACFS|nr:AB-hydrolase associated lipase region containing protein [Cavenderia fasciculata]EGG13630.1 AB-hydrolase associated lipase region containing protein [Cavenderia fasciculata]|eukprot:XP_004350334.1 AB-hydrolase associated lipase region containing protein [Cavenderia fasciculata]
MLFGFRVWVATVLSTYIDKTLISLNESIKAFVQECLFYRPGYLSYFEQRNRIKKRPPPSPTTPPLQQPPLTVPLGKYDTSNSNSSSNNRYNSNNSGIHSNPPLIGRSSSNTSQQINNNNVNNTTVKRRKPMGKRRSTPFVQLLNDSDSSGASSPNNSSFSLSSTVNNKSQPSQQQQQVDDNTNHLASSMPSIHYSPKKGMKQSASTSSIKRISSSEFLSSMKHHPTTTTTTHNAVNESTANHNNLDRPTNTTERKRKQKKLYYINRDLVHHHEQITTGFLEDIRTNILLFFDTVFYWLRTSLQSLLNTLASFKIRNLIVLIITFPLFLPYYILTNIFFKKVKDIPNRLISDKELDIRSVKEIIEQAGYPYEQYHVTTEDGYILLLERIPNPKSKNILYLQHGVFDNSFAWVANGPTQSLAFAAHDLGYDVFLGNLRGNGERLHTENNISTKQYWDFSINEHAFLDIPSFIQVIRQVKIKELSKFNDIVSPDDINISAVAHSMGAACILMYIVMMGILKKNHHLSRAILLSPAGYHRKAPKICDILGPLINVWLWFCPMHVFKFPSDTIRVIIAKIYHDVISNTPTKDLMVYLGSRFLLGGDTKNHPLEKIHNLAYNTFSGTSVKLYKHFWQMRKARKFQAYDYGSKQKNINVYGTPDPLNFLDHYDVINIPIHFVMGLKDNLIEPENIIKHYETLKKYHPELSFLKASKSGHIEFTLGLDDQILSYILRVLSSNQITTD